MKCFSLGKWIFFNANSFNCFIPPSQTLYKNGDDLTRVKLLEKEQTFDGNVEEFVIGSKCTKHKQPRCCLD